MIKCKAIYKLINDGEKINIKWICEELSVSVSSYYSHVTSVKTMEKRQIKELHIINEIKRIFKSKHCKLGGRRIKMKLDDSCKKHGWPIVN